MKKIITALFAGLLAAGSVPALDIEISGEIKTGLFTEQREQGGQTYNKNSIYNNDGDAGKDVGRIRLGLALQTEHFGIRTRFYQDNFKRKTGTNDTSIVGMDFAYAFASAFDNQLKISAGLLGESPWGTGGPELLKELEYDDNGYSISGIRTEWKPNFSYLRGLNLGFVLNRLEGTMPPASTISSKRFFGDTLMESILGIAYEHEYFAFRFAYRLDQGIDSPAAKVDGERLTYRVEERALRKLLPGMSIWANGYGKGINVKAEGRGELPYIQHWFYISYDPEILNAGLNTGYRDSFKNNAQQLELRPYFYYKLFNNLISVGAMGGMEIGFNSGKSFNEKDDPFYNFWFIEPQLRVNVNSNLYAAFVYRYTSGSYADSDTVYSFKDQQTHWVNLRICYTF